MKKLNIFLLFCIFCVSGRSQAVNILIDDVETEDQGWSNWPAKAGLGPVVPPKHYIPRENVTEVAAQNQTKFYDTKEECIANISKTNIVCVLASSGPNKGKYYAEGMGLLPMPRKPNAGETYIFA